jgi:two-component system cell cycle response regulator DivK
MSIPLLLVEDNDAIVKLVKAWLGSQGYDVTATCQPDEVMRAVVENPPRIILMDLNLPESDGLTLTRRVKSCAAGKAPIILAFTASATRDDESRVLEAGCDGYVSKPVRLAHLSEILSQHLAGSGPS